MFRKFKPDFATDFGLSIGCIDDWVLSQNGQIRQFGKI